MELLIKRREKGILFESGLVDGGEIMCMIVGLLVTLKIRPTLLQENCSGNYNITIGLLFFNFLSFLLVKSIKN